MKIPAEEWLAAIKIRRSRRKFNGVAVEAHTLNQLYQFCSDLDGVMPGARVVFSPNAPDGLFRGIVGSYGKIKGAPAYAAFIGDTADPFIGEKVGYLGEGLVLQATSLGLATCWVGGFFNPARVQDQIALQPGEKVFGVSPIGYVDRDYSLEEKTMSGFAGSHKRKGIPKIIRGIPPEQWPAWVQAAVEAARIAPSAINRQPWVFSIEKNSIVVSVDGPGPAFGIPKRLDCGIAMLHLEIGALACGIRGTWEHLNPPAVARFVPSEPVLKEKLSFNC